MNYATKTNKNKFLIDESHQLKARVVFAMEQINNIAT